MIRNSPAQSTDRNLPVYTPWKTFEGILDRLKEKGVPPKVDSSVMGGLAGGAQSALRSGMRFLGLIDQDAKAQDRLKALVAARGEESWKLELRRVIEAAYASVLADLDLMDSTVAMLEEKFRARGVEGQVLDKAMRFYLTALKEAEIPVSPHVDPSRNNPNGGAIRTRTRRKRSTTRREAGEGGAGAGSANLDAHTIAVPEGFTVYQYRLRKDLRVQLALPDDLNNGDVTRLHHWLRTLPFEEEQT